MHEWTRFALVGLVVFTTHCLEGVTGFGCTVLALPFVALLIGLEKAVPVLVVLAWLLAGYIVIKSRKWINWKEFRFILLHAAVGLPVGLLLFSHLPERELKLLLSFFMIGVGARGIWTVRHAEPPAEGEAPPTLDVADASGGAGGAEGLAAPAGLDAAGPAVSACDAGSCMAGAGCSGPAVVAVVAARPRSLLWNRLALLLGGIVHGAFGTGGPFVVIHAAKALPQKTLFRVTLCLLWLTLNTLMMLKWTWSGDVWTPDIGWLLIVTLPFLLGGMFLGDFLHHRVNEKLFRMLVYIVLAASGVVMLHATLNG